MRMLIVSDDDHGALGNVHSCVPESIQTRMWAKSNYISSWLVLLEAARSIMGEQIDVKTPNIQHFMYAQTIYLSPFLVEKKQKTLLLFHTSRAPWSCWAALSFSPALWLKCHDWGDVAGWKHQWRLSAVSCWLDFHLAVMSRVSTSHFQTGWSHESFIPLNGGSAVSLTL